MPKITFIEFSGIVHEVDAAAGRSLMKVAVLNEVPGIDAICKGCCSCGTCHCYVDPAWIERVPPASEEEQSILASIGERRVNSRLSCQIPVTDELDGLIVRLPESQLA